MLKCICFVYLTNICKSDIFSQLREVIVEMHMAYIAVCKRL